MRCSFQSSPWSSQPLPCSALAAEVKSQIGPSDGRDRKLHDGVMCFTVERCMAPRSTEKEKLGEEDPGVGREAHPRCQVPPRAQSRDPNRFHQFVAHQSGKVHAGGCTLSLSLP